MKNAPHYVSIFMVMHILFCSIVAQDFNEDNRTPLIEYVQDREDTLKKLYEEEKYLWDICLSTSVSTNYSTHYEITTTTYTIKPTCTLQQLYQLYNIRQQLKNFEKSTQEEIEEILESGALLSDQDDDGRTALSYAQSQAVYNALRNEGANFELYPFVGTHQAELSLYAALQIIPGIVHFCCQMMVNKQKQNFWDARREVSENLPINARDQMGRTPIMNYIIKQEGLIAVFKKDSYFTASKKYTKMIAETKNKITQMIQKGALLDMYDACGKTLTDYCQTTEIYEHLCSAGMMSDMKSWFYFNPYTTACMVVVPAAIFTALVYKPFTFEDRNIFDGFFEKEFLEKINNF